MNQYESNQSFCKRNKKTFCKTLSSSPLFISTLEEGFINPLYQLGLNYPSESKVLHRHDREACEKHGNHR